MTSGAGNINILGKEMQANLGGVSDFNQFDDYYNQYLGLV